MAMEESKVTKMKTFIIEEKFVGYADITIEAETEEEAIQIYKDGNYKDCNYDLDEYFYEYEFNSIREEKEWKHHTKSGQRKYLTHL